MNKPQVFISPRYIVFASDEGEEETSSSSTEIDNKETHSETSVSDDSNLLEQVTLTNHLLVGIILFLGVFFGAFCMSHLYNRIRKS